MSPEPTRPDLASDGEAEARKSTVDDLGQQHRDVFTRALFNVLSTPAAETTFAQILDGAPLSQSVQDVPGWIYPLDHPVRTQHLELCPGVLERTRHSRSTCDLKELKFDSQLFHKYHAASPGSRAFKTCLIEMIAVSIHQIAVYLYELDLDLGSHKDLVTWVAPANDKVFHRFYRDGKLPSLFIHKQYRDIKQYPNGAADMVGYWAEAQIFGGVVLFDRRKPCDREPHEDAQPDAVFFHSNHKNVTYRIWQLLDTQKKELLDFLLSEPDTEGNRNNGVPCPLPIYPDQKNLTRIDPEEPISETGIYRDLWERKPLGDDDGDPRAHTAAYNSLDYTKEEERAAAAEQQGEAEDELAKTLKKE
ncbi:hypothetical protein J7T55_000172 [Diaporthe amygdali]|uniref:uncharacterized protein n=1 Tax=Phomopsis amygdali TaxID=1214568 RepID=UPI0022FF0ABE|nr:uncharacterized protein J7T55_000172 [Diaporthe amygdali]KAJ0108207.1 hypothetical protein J7T55_000172 [Diaporthe amygdali]